MNPKLNDINKRQSEDEFLTYYSASSYIYSQAKTLTGLEAILSVPIPLLFSLGAMMFPQYKVWAAFYGITLTFLNILFFETWINSLKEEAAKVQEIFDCELLGIEWSSFRVGEKLLPERITFAASKYQKSSPDIVKFKEELKKILNTWYPDVSNLPFELAKIVCQRSNLWWDTELRELYVKYLKIIVTIICVAAIGSGIGLRMTMESFILSIMSVIFPTFLWFIKEIRKQLATIETLKRLTAYLNDMWKQALDKRLDQKQIQEKIRLIQDEIYIHRATNQPVFNWIHKRIKKKNDMDDQMNNGAKSMIEESLIVLGNDSKANN